MRKTRDWPAGAPLSDVQYPAISGTPRRVRGPWPLAPAAAVRVRDVVRVREGAMAGGDP